MIKRPILSRGAYRCLKHLKTYDFQKRGWACPSVATLMADMDRGERQIKRYVAELTRKCYLEVSRRPNASNKYTFLVNVTTDVTQNVPADVPADVTTIQLFLKHVNQDAPRAPKTQKEFAFMEMPYYYTDLQDRKLWRMAARWIAQNNPNLAAYSMDRAAPIMELLELAGARDLAEHAPLPAITWPPVDFAARGRHPDAKPPEMALAQLAQKLGAR